MTLRLRHLGRWAVVTIAGLIGLLIWWPAPGYAHDGVKITIEHDGRGSVWATVRWQDGHPVTEEITATVSAREFGGQTVERQPMPGTGPGAIRYTGSLTEGRWTVNVDVAKPGRGVCAAVFAVGPQAPSESVRCDDPPVAPAAAPETDESPLGVVALAALLAAVLVGTAVAWRLRRRRSTPV